MDNFLEIFGDTQLSGHLRRSTKNFNIVVRNLWQISHLNVFRWWGFLPWDRCQCSTHSPEYRCNNIFPEYFQYISRIFPIYFQNTGAEIYWIVQHISYWITYLYFTEGKYPYLHFVKRKNIPMKYLGFVRGLVWHFLDIKQPALCVTRNRGK